MAPREPATKSIGTSYDDDDDDDGSLSLVTWDTGAPSDADIAPECTQLCVCHCEVAALSWRSAIFLEKLQTQTRLRAL